MIIDTHCHFDMMPNPEAYISQKEKQGDVVIGMTNLPSHFQLGRPHLKSFKRIRLALGFHPLLVAEHIHELSLFKKYVRNTSYIGEIGLDFSKEGVISREVQVLVLREILSELKGEKKVISVHSRGAEKELFGLLCEYDIQNVIFHWYSGSIDLIPSILSEGYYFSVNEAMTMSKNGRAIVEKITKDRILTETDAPFNTKVDIRKALANMQMTEEEVRNNYLALIAKIK